MTLDMNDVTAVVQRQLEAYNARDLDALMATYAPSAQQYLHPGQLVADGHAQIRQRMAQRLLDPILHARLLARSVMGNVVVDHEVVTRSFEGEGSGTQEMVMVYQVKGGLIQSASVILGEKVLHAAP